MNQTIVEIRNQYEALEKTLDLFDKKREALSAAWKEAAPKALVFLGCGSSYMVSCSLRDAAGAMTDLPVYAFAAGDLWLNHTRYRRQLSGALVVAVSRSGRTSEILHAVDALESDGVNFTLCSLVAAVETPLGQRSAISVEIPWAFDESVCQTRSVSNLYAAGLSLLAAFTGDETLPAQLRRLAAEGPAYLQKAQPFMARIAKEDWNKALVLADGVSAGLATEGALAFQEISQLPGVQHHVLDVRHGPIVLVDEKTLALVYLYPDGQPQQEALIRDLQKRGAKILIYSNLPREIPGTESICLGAEVGEAAGAIAFLNLCQLAAYEKSMETGSDPDAPTGLDAWIQVN